MISSDLLYIGGLILATLIGLRVFLPLFYRRGRQVEFRLARGTGTGEVIGLSGLRLRVRSLSSGHEHTVSLNNVRRR